MKSRKGFTLVELLVVIAILAILATASIIGFTAFTRRAEVSNDSELVAQLNKYAQAATVSKDFKTVTEMRDELIESGFELANLKLDAEKQGYAIGFDIKKDRFVLLKGTEAAEGYTIENPLDVFVFVNNAADAEKYGKGTVNKYSLYLQNGFSVTGTLDIKTGLDVGEVSGITSISYSNNSAQEVVIRTNSANTTLTINAASDTVKHYGAVGSLNIIAVANSSYHEFGQVAFAEIKTGRIVLESKSEVEHLHLAATDGNFVDITVAKANDVEMPDFSRDPVDLSSGSKLIVALQDGTHTTDAKDYVWLTEVGIYEQVTLGTADAAGTNYAAASSSQEKKDAAQQIANNITFSEGGQDYKVTATKVNDEWTYEVKTEAGQEATGYSASVSGTTVSVTNTSTSQVVNTNRQNGLTEKEKALAQAEIVTSAEVAEAGESGDSKNAKALIDIAPNGTFTYFTLIEFKNAVNNGTDFSGHTIKLCGDVDLDGVAWNDPIGNNNYPFEGTFDGQNYTIKNLSNNGENSESYATNTSGYATSGDLLGLFGYIKGNTTFKNLNIEAYFYTGQSESVIGGLYAKCQTAGSVVTVENVNVSGRMQGTKYVAGLIGQHTNGTLLIYNCENSADITCSGNKYAAGILAGSHGNCIGKLTFTNCKNSGSINAGTGNAAGIVANLNQANSVATTKTSEQNWRDVINSSTFTYSGCINDEEKGILTGTNKSNLFLDVSYLPSSLSSAMTSNAYIKKSLQSYYNNVGIIGIDWQSVDKYGILEGIAYTTDLSGYVAIVGDCHAKTIGDASLYQSYENVTLLLLKDYVIPGEYWLVQGSVDFNSHSVTGKIRVNATANHLFKNGEIEKLAVYGPLTLENMRVTGTSIGQGTVDIYYQDANYLVVKNGNYSFNPTSTNAVGISFVADGYTATLVEGVWVVTAE